MPSSQARPSPEFRIGVDLGGTKIEAIALTEDSRVLLRRRVATPRDDYAATLAYAKQLAAFRPGTPFAMVPKGWMCLRWGDEFAKHGPFLLGERAPAFLRERLAARQGEWNPVNHAWLRHYPLAARFYREVLAINPHLLATGLVEDGLFEACIQPSVALFAETLWNPHQSDADLLTRALRPYLTATTA